MIKLHRFLLVLPGLLIANLTPAHAPLPSLSWCSGPNVRVVNVTGFKFAAVEVTSFAQCLRSGRCLDVAVNTFSCPPEDCGESADDWGAGNRMARQYCSLFQGPPSSVHPNIGSVIINVTTPASFNLSTHHNVYKASDGLIGECLRCEAN